MTPALLWDGLGIPVPQGMEPTVLDRGYVRLAGPEQTPPQMIDLRFGPASRFDPVRDGRRLTRAAGLPSAPLTPLPISTLPPDTICYRHDRLYVLHLQHSSGVVAALFAAAPQEDLLQTVLTGMVWNGPDQWRTWQCFDLYFETPPQAVLSKASFQPGHFHLEFARARTVWTFDRLVPADILLAGTTLQDWTTDFLHAPGNLSFAGYEDQLSFTRPLSGARRLFSLLTQKRPDLCGLSQHDRTRNRLLLFTQQGRPLPQPDYERMATAYGHPTLPH